MKIVLLDGHTINPGDLTWKKLEDLCDEFIVYELTPQELVQERIGDCDVLMTSPCTPVVRLHSFMDCTVNPSGTLIART